MYHKAADAKPRGLKSTCFLWLLTLFLSRASKTVTHSHCSHHDCDSKHCQPSLSSPYSLPPPRLPHILSARLQELLRLHPHPLPLRHRPRLRQPRVPPPRRLRRRSAHLHHPHRLLPDPVRRLRQPGALHHRHLHVHVLVDVPKRRVLPRLERALHLRRRRRLRPPRLLHLPSLRAEQHRRRRAAVRHHERAHLRHPLLVPRDQPAQRAHLHLLHLHPGHPRPHLRDGPQEAAVQLLLGHLQLQRRRDVPRRLEVRGGPQVPVQRRRRLPECMRRLREEQRSLRVHGAVQLLHLQLRKWHELLHQLLLRDGLMEWWRQARSIVDGIWVDLCMVACGLDLAVNDTVRRWMKVQCILVYYI